ncbi:MAG: DUF3574 domain-containing protein [Gemmatimonadota bacterium]
MLPTSRAMAVALVGLAGLGCASGSLAGAASTVPAAAPFTCEASTHPFTRWTLYFGMKRPQGADITEADWDAFLRNEVTPRFPSGFTVLDGHGQWRGDDGTIVREPSRILILLQPDTRGIRFAIGEIVSRYKALFQQESVIEELTRVCAAF